MNATVIGSQLGDEGKGGTVDLFADAADVVVRYQGGANAGHTVVHDGTQYALRLVPSGVIRGTLGVIGNGCVVDLETLFNELDRLRDSGIDPDVKVAGRAHVVLPYHRVLDEASEASRRESDFEVGTTGNGIGPAYEDKAGRRGLRVAELLRPEVLRDRLDRVVAQKRRLATEVYGIDAGEAFDVDALYERLRTLGERLATEEMVVDAGRFLTERIGRGDTILFEGAQGTQIDVDHGNYPYVTSSNPSVGGAITGTGVGPTTVADGAVVGVVKAYLSRVGSGALPTELSADAAAAFREQVGGFGTVTGRARRIGWLDLPVLRTAARVNGYTGLVVNHVDALAGLDELRVCESYDLGGERRSTVPATAADWADCSPNYVTMDTWTDQDWGAVATEGYDALPDAARAYVEFVSDALGVPIYAVGVGPSREETILLQNPLETSVSTSEQPEITTK